MTIPELNERINFFNNEYHKLRAESIMENNPTAKYGIEQNMKEALMQKEIAEKLLENILLSSVNADDIKKSVLVNFVPKTASNPADKKPPHSTEPQNPVNLLQRPISYIGITVFAGVLVILIGYLIKQHFGINL